MFINTGLVVVPGLFNGQSKDRPLNSLKIKNACIYMYVCVCDIFRSLSLY